MACWARNINGFDNSGVEHLYLHSLGMNGSFHMVRPVADESTGKVNMLSGSFSTNYIWMATISLPRVFFPWWAFSKCSLPWPTPFPFSPAGSAWVSQKVHFFPLYCTQESFAERFFFWNHLIVWYLDQRKKTTHSWLKIEDFIAQLCSWWWMIMVRNIFPYKSWFVNGLFLHLFFATQMLTAV